METKQNQRLEEQMRKKKKNENVDHQLKVPRLDMSSRMTTHMSTHRSKSMSLLPSLGGENRTHRTSTTISSTRRRRRRRGGERTSRSRTMRKSSTERSLQKVERTSRTSRSVNVDAGSLIQAAVTKRVRSRSLFT